LPSHFADAFPTESPRIPNHLFLLVGNKEHNRQLGINSAAATDEKLRFYLRGLERHLEIPTKLVVYGPVQGFELIAKGLDERKFQARANS